MTITLRCNKKIVDCSNCFVGNIWKIGFSISKLQEAVKDLRVTAKSRVKESKEAILFQSEEENDDQTNNAGGDLFSVFRT